MPCGESVRIPFLTTRIKTTNADEAVSNLGTKPPKYQHPVDQDPSRRRTLSLLLLDPIEHIHHRHHGLPTGTHEEGRGRPSRLVDTRARQRPGDQRDQEEQPPVPRPVLLPDRQQVRVDQQVDPRGRRHGGGDLGDAQTAALHDLAAAGKGEQGDDEEVTGPRVLHPVAELECCCCEDHGRLREIAQDQPQPQPRADDVAQLARQVAAREEEAERDADVGRVEHVAVELRDDDRDGQEHGVAGLVGGKAVIVGEGDCILYAGAKRQEE